LNKAKVSSTPLLLEQVLSSSWRIPWFLFRSRELATMREKRKTAGRFTCASASIADAQAGAPFFLPGQHHKTTILVAPMTRAPLWIKKGEQ
jgi:hypothetical protein